MIKYQSSDLTFNSSIISFLFVASLIWSPLRVLCLVLHKASLYIHINFKVGFSVTILGEERRNFCSIPMEIGMRSAEDGNHGTLALDQGEWLNLSLGRNSPSTSKESESHTPTGKVYSCNFCKRKFYSSQALGGHQNAHKRERGAVRQYQSQRMMTMMAFPINNPMFRSLGINPHALAHKSGRDVSATAATFSEASAGFQMTSHSNQMDRSFYQKWPGSFQLNQQQSKDQASNPNKLDLNLKL